MLKARGVFTAAGEMSHLALPGSNPPAPARVTQFLPIHYRAIVGIVPGAVLLGFPNFSHQLVFVYGYADAWLGR